MVYTTDEHGFTKDFCEVVYFDKGESVTSAQDRITNPNEGHTPD